MEFLLRLAGVDLSTGEAQVASSLVYLGAAVTLLLLLYNLIFSAEKRQTETQPAQLPSAASCSLLIRSRRSVMPKDLSGEPVTRDELETLLEARLLHSLAPHLSVCCLLWVPLSVSLWH